MSLLLISRVLSPFQLELVGALRDHGCDAHVIFSTGDIGTRPKHWEVEVPPWAHLDDVERHPQRLRGHFDRLQPKAVVYGGYRGLPLEVCVRLCRSRHIGLAMWLEAPFPTAEWRSTARELVIRRAIQRADYVMAMGPKALEYYERLLENRGRLVTLPYGQDLSANLAWERPWRSDGPVTFVFSGKYQHRNNIWEMLSAFRDLRRDRGDEVQLVLSGYAEMDREVRAEIQRDAVLRSAVRHDVDFERWDDRLRPFRDSDVFLLPGIHAGWGLVVPEAMSLAMPVIGSVGIESVRALVRHERSGLLVQPVYHQIRDAMERLVDDRALLRRLGEQARIDSQVVHAPNVARRLLDLLAPHLEG